MFTVTAWRRAELGAPCSAVDTFVSVASVLWAGLISSNYWHELMAQQYCDLPLSGSMIVVAYSL
jgi:hypothetical protein